MSLAESRISGSRFRAQGADFRVEETRQAHVNGSCVVLTNSECHPMRCSCLCLSPTRARAHTHTGEITKRFCLSCIRQMFVGPQHSLTVCVRVRIRARTLACLYTHTCVYMGERVEEGGSTFQQMTNSIFNAVTHACTHTYARSQTQTHTQTHTHTHSLTHSLTHSHSHTHR